MVQPNPVSSRLAHQTPHMGAQKEQTMTDILRPKDHAEAVALFRAQVIGPLVCRDDLTHGELAEDVALGFLLGRGGGAVAARATGDHLLHLAHGLVLGGLEPLTLGLGRGHAGELAGLGPVEVALLEVELTRALRRAPALAPPL
jgi:hypothetical protein